ELVQALILKIEPENRRLSLGIKQLQQDAWECFCQQKQAGDAVRGKVARKASCGVFVERAEGVEGLCHISEIADSVDKHSIPLEVGEEREFKIIKLNP